MLDLAVLAAQDLGRFKLVQLAAGKRTLVVGPVSHKPAEMDEQRRRGLWTFDYFNRYCSRAVGVDITEEGVEYMRQLGLEALVGDIQNLRLDETFECITVANVVDHLLDLPGFLRSCHDLLEPGGTVLVYDDNPLSLPVLLRNRLKYGPGMGIARDNVFKPQPGLFRNFVGRFGFSVAHLEYLSAKPRARRLYWALRPLLDWPDLLHTNYLCVLLRSD